MTLEYSELYFASCSHEQPDTGNAFGWLGRIMAGEYSGDEDTE